MFSAPGGLAPKLKRTGNRPRRETGPQDQFVIPDARVRKRKKKEKIEKNATLAVWSSVTRFSDKSLLLAPYAQFKTAQHYKQRGYH
jgi:hypothetical protein